MKQQLELMCGDTKCPLNHECWRFVGPHYTYVFHVKKKLKEFKKSPYNIQEQTCSEYVQIFFGTQEEIKNEL